MNPNDVEPFDRDQERQELSERHKIKQPTQLEIVNLAATMLSLSNRSDDLPIEERTWEAVHHSIKLWEEAEMQLLDHERHTINPYHRLPKTMDVYSEPLYVYRDFLPRIEGGFEGAEDGINYERFLLLVVGSSSLKSRESRFVEYLMAHHKISKSAAEVEMNTYRERGFYQPAIDARLYRVWRIESEKNNYSCGSWYASECNLKQALDNGRREEQKKVKKSEE